jgi:hypothetical protein
MRLRVKEVRDRLMLDHDCRSRAKQERHSYQGRKQTGAARHQVKNVE